MKSWLDLEERFRKLSPALHYYRIDAQWGAAGEFWHLAGGNINSSTVEYELLSDIAGTMLSKTLSPKKTDEKILLDTLDSKVRWYNALKSKSTEFQAAGYGEQKDDNGKSAGFIYWGSIRSIGEAAANLCLSLETTHPLKERKSKIQWLHDNYLKALILTIFSALIALGIKWVFS